MAEGYFGQPFKSKSIAWSASSLTANDVPVDFLYPAMDNFDAPCVSEILIRSTITCTTVNGGGGALGSLLPQLLPHIFIKDQFGTRVDVRGESLRCIEYCELGLSMSDCISTSTTSLALQGKLGNNFSGTIEVWQCIPVCTPQKAARPQDYRIPCELFRGGQMTLDFGGPTIGAAAANQIVVSAAATEFWFWVIDEVNREDKMRWVCRDYAMNLNEQNFAVPPQTRVRSQLFYDGAVNENAGTAMTSAQNMFSVGLGMASVRATMLQQQYLKRSRTRQPDPAQAVTPEDPVVNGHVIPIVSPQGFQGVSEMPEVSIIDFKTDAATVPTGSRMVATYIENRPEASQHVVLGGEATHNKAADGGSIDHAILRKKNPSLARKIPVTRAA